MNSGLKDRIVKKSSELFLLHGIKSITMDYIANQMGISKRTLYETFSDKDSLLLAVLEYMESVKMKETEEIAKTTTNSIELFLKVYKNALRRLRNMNRNYLRDLKRYHPKVSTFFDQRKEENIQNHIRLTKQGISEGYIRPDLNPEIVALLLGAQFEMLMNSEELDTNRFTFSEVFETIVMNFARGIVTPKGLALIEEFEEKEQYIKQI